MMFLPSLSKKYNDDWNRIIILGNWEWKIRLLDTVNCSYYQGKSEQIIYVIFVIYILCIINLELYMLWKII